LQFLGEVLQATAESNGDAAVVHPLLQQNLEKLDLTFAQTLKTWATETLETATYTDREAIAKNLCNFDLIISSFRHGSRANNIEIAIACLEMNFQVFTREHSQVDWALTQNNLGPAGRARGEHRVGDRLLSSRFRSENPQCLCPRLGNDPK